MDLTGLEEGIFAMFLWWICLLTLLSFFIDYGATVSITACAVYVFATWKWAD
jgi:hypothetical protein